MVWDLCQILKGFNPTSKSPLYKDLCSGVHWCKICNKKHCTKTLNNVALWWWTQEKCDIKINLCENHLFKIKDEEKNWCKEVSSSYKMTPNHLSLVDKEQNENKKRGESKAGYTRLNIWCIV